MGESGFAMNRCTGDVAAKERTMKARVTRIGIFLGFAAMLGISADASSAKNVDGFVFQVSNAAGATVEATRSTIAFNSTDNQYLVVWEQENAATNGTTDEIYGQLLQGDGTKIGLPFRISTSDVVGDELGAGHPDVTYDSQDNQYYVVWESDIGTRDTFGIHGREIEANGTLVGSEHTLVYPSGPEWTDARHPAVTYNAVDHRYAVAYEMTKAYVSTTPGILSEIRLSVLDSNEPPGWVYWNVVGIESPPTRDAFAPDIEYNSVSNRYLLVWTRDMETPPGHHEIFGSLQHSGGGGLGGILQISDMQRGGTDRDGFDAAVVYNQDLNDFLVTWCGDGVGTADTLQNDAYETWGQLLDHNGVTTRDDFVISDARAAGPDRDAYRSVPVYNDYDRIYLVFDEADAGVLTDDTYEIFARRLESDGDVDPPYLNVTVMSDAGADRDARIPSVAYNSQYHDYMVTWNGDGGAASNDDDEVFANRSYLRELPVFFGFVGAAVVDGSAVEITWMVAADEQLAGFKIYRQQGDDSPMVLIADRLPADVSTYLDADIRPGGTYLYTVSAVDTDGSETRSMAAKVTVTPRQFALGQNYPNPFNPTTTITFDLPLAASVSIIIYDVLGHEVRRLVDEVKPAGRHETTWRGRNNLNQPVASGAYFYRFTALASNGKSFSTVKKLVLMK
jgi:hypothetical protein